MCRHAFGGQRMYCGIQVFPVNHMSSGNQSWVQRAGSKCLSLWSHSMPHDLGPPLSILLKGSKRLEQPPPINPEPRLSEAVLPHSPSSGNYRIREGLVHSHTQQDTARPGVEPRPSRAHGLPATLGCSASLLRKINVLSPHPISAGRMAPLGLHSWWGGVRQEARPRLAINWSR